MCLLIDVCERVFFIFETEKNLISFTVNSCTLYYHKLSY